MCQFTTKPNQAELHTNTTTLSVLQSAILLTGVYTIVLVQVHTDTLNKDFFNEHFPV